MALDRESRDVSEGTRLSRLVARASNRAFRTIRIVVPAIVPPLLTSCVVSLSSAPALPPIPSSEEIQERLQHERGMDPVQERASVDGVQVVVQSADSFGARRYSHHAAAWNCWQAPVTS